MSSRIINHDGINVPSTPYPKDPNDIKEYKFAWGRDLRDGETLGTIEWFITPNNFYTIEDQNDELPDEVVKGKLYTNIVSVWLSGGTANQIGLLTCRATINLPLTDPLATRISDKSLYIPCKEM